MVAIVSPDDDSVFIYTNSASSSDGAGEAVSYLYYDNPSYPTFTGWYNSLALFGATYDLDYLIAPRVSYDLHDSFNILDDTICPEVVSAGCITYAAKPVFSDPHYNSNFASPNSEIVFLWGDFTQNTGLTSACHTYDTPGVYNINVVDLLSRHNFGASDCPVDITQSIYVLDTVAANFTFVETGLNVDFTDLSTNHDSVWWDFGDATGSAVNNPSHAYATVGSFDVWLHVYNECFEDSIMMTVVTNDLGLENSEFKFNMFPNPASQTLILEGTIAGATVTISNVLGQTVYTAEVTGSKEVIPVSSFSSGAYFVNVSGSNGVSTKKLVVQH
jgi:PKD repeat protein